MGTADDNSIDLLFRKARTHNGWQDKPVSDELLQRVYDLAKWGPTSANCCPMRITFVKSREAKEKLAPCMDKGNLEKTMAAPATAIIGYDMEFYKKMDKLWHSGGKMFEKTPEDALKVIALRNGSLQGGYFLLAARALGLDCGPMSGFNNAKVDAAFFAGTAIKSNFLCNLGYGDPSKLYPRGARLDFNEACRIE
jgi:nitroreductase